jgi:heat shock protein HslJ
MKKVVIKLGIILLLIIAGVSFYIFNADEFCCTPPSDRSGNSSENETPRVGENLEGEADPSRMTLDMTTWVWISALYNDGREVKPNKEKAFTLTLLKDGRFSATTDCNSMSGTYVANKTNGTITFGPITSTLMFCADSQETEFSNILTNTSGYHFTSRGELILDLKFDSGSAVFR